jgi:hypothetical protein
MTKSTMINLHDRATSSLAKIAAIERGTKAALAYRRASAFLIL